MSFTFMFGGNVVANPHTERLSPLVACSEFLQMLMFRKSSEVHLYGFSIVAFHRLVDALHRNRKLLLSDDIIGVIELSDFFLIPSIYVVIILPKRGLGRLEMNVKAKILHTLHHCSYNDMSTPTMLVTLRLDPSSVNRSASAMGEVQGKGERCRSSCELAGDVSNTNVHMSPVYAILPREAVAAWCRWGPLPNTFSRSMWMPLELEHI